MRPQKLNLGGLEFAVAEATDGTDLERLSSRPMAGDWLSLSIATRHDYQRAARIRGEHDALIVRRAAGDPVGMCARSVRDAYIDGAVRPLGYLGELRLSEARNRRPRLVRDGFAAVRELLHEPQRTPYYLTAIADGNEAAERLLTAGLSGLPTYRFVGELTTLAIGTHSCLEVLRPRPRPPAGIVIERACEGDIESIAQCLGRNHRRYQFAPVWTVRDLADPVLVPGLRPEDYLVARCGGTLIGCLALWDQRPFKQVVIAGYGRGIGRWRPLLNLAAPLAGWPRLPPAGSTLAQAFLSHVAVDGEDGDVLVALIDAARRAARSRGIELLLIGIGKASPMFSPIARQFAHRAYGSRLYLVYWEDGRAAAEALSGRTPQPEIALM